MVMINGNHCMRGRIKTVMDSWLSLFLFSLHKTQVHLCLHIVDI